MKFARLAAPFAIVACLCPPSPATAQQLTEFPLPDAGANAFGIAPGPDGNVWFTEYSHLRIGRITPAGAISYFRVTANPYHITLGPDQALWFTTSAPRIGRATPDGFVTDFPLPAGFAATSDIAPGPDGALWFTGPCDRGIGRLRTDGVVTEFPVPTVGGCPSEITAGPDGRMWFTEHYGNKIGAITTDGVITEYVVGPVDADYPDGIIAGPDGNLWFTNNFSNLNRITRQGAITKYQVFGYNFAGIAVGPDGNFWLTGPLSNQVGRVSLLGVQTDFLIPTPDSRPTDITRGPDGALWFVESQGDKIGRITAPLQLVPVPTLSGLALAVFGVALGAIGFWIARSPR